VSARVTLGRERIAWRAAATVAVWQDNQQVRDVPLPADGCITVRVAPEGITALVITGVEPRVAFQNMLLAPAPALPAASVSELGWRDGHAVALSFGELTSVYAYLPDVDRQLAKATLHWRQGDGAFQEDADTTFPFDYTVQPHSGKTVEYYFTVELKDGRTEQSPVGRVELR
jgi:hypothetical protein